MYNIYVSCTACKEDNDIFCCVGSVVQHIKFEMLAVTFNLREFMSTPDEKCRNCGFYTNPQF